ncbi:hypothetical protein C440_06742 [Haloferax mucosum ATCC BAA-1512]|uniref:Uncharacterized protein n=1 Tax=Haloferax mucosum ATCC BAA-1512 TaxID=662479 RepID=M0IIV8_9EURY|nr:hypothetical protein [Haloferax mucosum]ELZ95967.1 hypothetical protein C440_06742 [Haloferax mucosum ATCC BAA-1512]
MCPQTDESNREYGRRSVLRRSVGALVVGLTGATSGCLSGLPPVGPKQHFGRLDVPQADPPRYRRWLPAPSVADGLDDEHYGFLFRRPSKLEYPAPIRFIVPRKRLLRETDYFGIDYDSYGTILETPFGTVIEADFDRQTVVDTLAEGGYQKADTYTGYDVFSRSDVRRRAAVSDDAIVWSNENHHERANIELVVDAEAGDVPRYHESNDDFKRLSEKIGESRMVELTPPLEGARYWMSCEAFRFDEQTAYHVRSFLFPDGTTVPKERLKERGIGGTVLTREVENSDLRFDGRMATFEGRIPPKAGVHPSNVKPSYPPQVTWGVTYETDSESAVVRHEVGESVPAERISLAFDVARDAPGVGHTKRVEGPLFTDSKTVEPGDTATVDLRNPPAVRVKPPLEVDEDTPDSDWETRPATLLKVILSGEVSYPLFCIALPDSGGTQR